MTKDEIIIYQANDQSTVLEVRVEDETVWLNRNQIALLFARDIKTIGKHINNVLKEELRDFSVIAKFATTASDGKIYQVEYYNLDMIISVGYRVKSQRGIQFRIWANKILKDYLLKGHAINQRFERIEDNVHYLKRKVNEFDFQIKTNLPPNEGIFYEGQIFDAWQFVSDLIKSANKSIVLIDNYVDESVLVLLSKRKPDVTATIYTSSVSRQLKLDLKLFNTQYSPVEVKIFKKSHDRFLIIDNETVYHIGASLKDLGKKWFAFSKMELDPTEMIKKLI
ncbi:MAG: virulence RhuM family protein [Bacteroidales bacterium]|nr:virulence RhuM family protein [Bacteroidales bacterium]